jgi:FKBP-type peptidyl-prolyl cis-trans isomerase (trigger factor)
MERLGILITIGAVAVAGITGGALEPASAVQIFGFATIVVVQLLALLRQSATVDKLDQAAVKVGEVKEALAVSNAEVAGKLNDATTKVDEVKTTLATNDAKTSEQIGQIVAVGLETKKTIDVVHSLVNSAMTTALRSSATALRRVAQMTRDPEDGEAADLAEQALARHESNQIKADAVPETSEPLHPEIPHTTDPPQ